MKDWVTWVEPYGTGAEPVFCFMRAEEAGRAYRVLHANYPYESDAQALEDFMVVNWAVFCGDPNGSVP